MDLSWLATEAKTLHGVFEGMFFSLALSLLLIGVILEIFKIPMGGTPELSQLLSRVLIAVVLMAAVPDVMNMLADFSDGMTEKLGAFNDFKHVKDRLKEQISSLSLSWVSVKDAVLLVISLISYVILLVGLHLADAIFVYAWLLLYVFSPILTACFILPVTSGATKMLFKSLIEVTVWKCLWAVMGALVWSMAASKVNDPQYQMNFLTVIILNLLLFFSLWKVPSLTSAFMQGGVSQVASGLGSNLWDRASNFAKDVTQLYGARKILKTMAGTGKNKKFPSNGRNLGSHKYQSIQNKKD